MKNIYLNGLVQKRCNSRALAMELRLSCTNPLNSNNEVNVMAADVLMTKGARTSAVMILIKFVRNTVDLVWAELTHWGRDKMVAILQTTYSNSFFFYETVEFQIKFHWNIFLRDRFTMSYLWFVIAWDRTGNNNYIYMNQWCPTLLMYIKHSASRS